MVNGKNNTFSMKTNFNFKTYKDKFFIIPTLEISWEVTNKILTFKLAFIKWASKVSFNF